MSRIAICGTGFIGTGLALALEQHPRLTVSQVFTRRSLDQVAHPLPAALTNDRDALLSDCDLLVECSGDVLLATEMVVSAHARGIPVVTMNSEFHVTVGSAFVETGYLTEAEGDQPGSLAALNEKVTAMGFKPVVFGNIKGFLNPTPNPDDMAFWAEKQGISLPQVTAFTDGTKIQIEQALVANGLGGTLLCPGMQGPTSADLEAAARQLAAEAEAIGDVPVSDYVLNAGGPAGVFIVARHDDAQQRFLKYLKLGEGPYYFLLQPFHLCHLEMVGTIEAVLDGRAPLLTNGRSPTVGVCAIAKTDLGPGDRIERALGSFQFRGEAMAFEAHREYAPIGLMQDCQVVGTIQAGQRVRWDQVELPDSLALRCFRNLLEES
ncbi:NAD(P)-dependent oxidoreductase [Alcanivorax sp. DP30]|uniref:NAD(P)-dependent oxidoreductase n=1 Tax=Alcanivorax sp. DP30 TaxID=2606217 RepID=UPI00136C521F|nr:NAD(P)-dependent oxidoreductase [Alcanivorax sp. DP30]MZR63227.1 NAD(P)-dependent oxidoreductase [Alcanivorax sp. DP30]